MSQTVFIKKQVSQTPIYSTYIYRLEDNILYKWSVISEIIRPGSIIRDIRNDFTLDKLSEGDSIYLIRNSLMAWKSYKVVSMAYFDSETIVKGI